jgi:hypothetical protein
MHPLQNVDMRKTHTLVQTNFPEFCVLRLPLIHVLCGYMYDVQIQNAHDHYPS